MMLVSLISLIDSVYKWIENVRAECLDEECTSEQLSIRIMKGLHALKYKDMTIYYKGRVLSTSSNFEGHHAMVTIDDLEILDRDKIVPVCVSITIANQTNGKNIEYQDIIAAAIVNVRNGSSFVSERNDKVWYNLSNGGRYYELSKNTITKIDPISDVYLCNVENMSTRDTMIQFYKKWCATKIDSSGSSLFDAIYVLSGQAQAYLNLEMKNIHLGAVYFLSSINDTALKTMNGEELNDKAWGIYIENQLRIDFSDTNSVAMAGTQEYLEKFIKMLK